MSNEQSLQCYVGRTMQVPRGRQRIDKIRAGSDDKHVVVTLSGLDTDGAVVYTDDAELPLQVLEVLYRQ